MTFLVQTRYTADPWCVIISIHHKSTNIVNQVTLSSRDIARELHPHLFLEANLSRVAQNMLAALDARREFLMKNEVDRIDKAWKDYDWGRGGSLIETDAEVVELVYGWAVQDSEVKKPIYMELGVREWSSNIREKNWHLKGEFRNESLKPHANERRITGGLKDFYTLKEIIDKPGEFIKASGLFDMQTDTTVYVGHEMAHTAPTAQVNPKVIAGPGVNVDRSTGAITYEQRPRQNGKKSELAQRSKNPKYWAHNAEDKINGVLQQVEQNLPEDDPTRRLIKSISDALHDHIGSFSGGN